MCIIFGAWIQWIYKGLLWEDSGPSGTPLNFLQLPFRICQIWNLVFGNWKALKASTIKNTPVQPKFSLCCLLRWSWPTVLCGVPVRALWIAGYYCIIYGSCYCAKAPEHLCYCQSQKDWTSSTSDTLLSVTLCAPMLLWVLLWQTLSQQQWLSQAAVIALTPLTLTLLTLRQIAMPSPPLADRCSVRLPGGWKDQQSTFQSSQLNFFLKKTCHIKLPTSTASLFPDKLRDNHWRFWLYINGKALFWQISASKQKKKMQVVSKLA